MSERIAASLRSFVRKRARGRCEYCLLHEDDSNVPHEPDHILACKHGAPTEESNLAWTCFACNRHKGTDISSLDPASGIPVFLFNPRQDRWSKHFRLEGSVVVPLTASGRATVRLLQINRPFRVRARSALMARGLYPRND